MIALTGRRSVASLVERLLGVVNIFVLIGAIGCLVSLGALMVAPDMLMNATRSAGDIGPGIDGAGPDGLGWVMAGGLFACVFTWLTLHYLGRMLRAVNDGRAFEFANVGRLRAIGAALAGLQLSMLLLGALAPVENGTSRINLDLGAWLGVLVVFILAEVFRQGSDMRDENQNTV
jgi:hypothetical protein